MGLFGTSKAELEQEIERLTAENKALRKQNKRLLMLYDAWITSIRENYYRPKPADGGAKHMSWGGSDELFRLDEKMQEDLKTAKSRPEKVRAYSKWVPEIVKSILYDVRYISSLYYDNTPQYMKKYEEVMSSVRMYFPAVGNVKNYDEIRIGDPPK